jgi:hypothetical protein
MSWSVGESLAERVYKSRSVGLQIGICLAALVALVEAWHSMSWRSVTATVSERPSKCWLESQAQPSRGSSDIRFDGRCDAMPDMPHKTPFFELHVMFKLENGRSGAATIRTSWDPKHPPKPGDTVELRVDPDHIAAVERPLSSELQFEFLILVLLAFGIVTYHLRRLLRIDVATPVMRAVLRFLGVVVADEALELHPSPRTDTPLNDARRPFGRKRHARTAGPD